MVRITLLPCGSNLNKLGIKWLRFAVDFEALMHRCELNDPPPN